MRRIFFVAVPVIVCGLLIVAIPARAVAQQTQTPEHQQLGVWVGEWSYVLGDGSGTMEFEWFGDLIIRASEVTPAGYNVHHFLGYDAEEEGYWWHRYWNNGYTDTAKGWLHDNQWTFIFAEPAGNIRRMTMTFESQDVIAFKWERSTEGGPWEAFGEGRTTRVR